MNTEFPKIDDYDATTIEELLERAQNALEDEVLQSAVDLYQLASSIDPTSAEARIGLGDSYFGLGDYENAEASYRVGLQLEPDNADGLLGLAATLRVTEIFAEAVDLYSRALEIEPERTVAYWELAYSREMIGDIVGAEIAYRTCLKYNPNLGMAKHLLAAMLGTTTDRAPDDYVRELFDDYADSFENDLVEDLNYVVPDIIRKELEILLTEGNYQNKRQFRTALDLGCGTGLVSEAIMDLVEIIEGVDLSENMLKIAREQQRYNHTYIAEMTGFLVDKSLGHLSYELILCGDSLVYLGDLKPLFIGVKNRLASSGYFCFTLENLQRGQFNLCHTGRYAHSERYISFLAQEVGFDIRRSKSIIPRTDIAKDIDGRLYVLGHLP